MRKVSIFLLVGLMLVGGFAVGVSAQNNGGSASNNAAPTGTVSDTTVNTNATAQINTIVALYVHPDVDLGTLDSASFDSSGNFTDLSELESTGNIVKAFSNTSYTVNVKVSSNGVSSNNSFDLDDFKFSPDTTKGSPSWSAFGGTGSSNSIEVFDAGSSAGKSTTEVGYKYLPDASDAPGTYKAELTYTISTG